MRYILTLVLSMFIIVSMNSCKDDVTKIAKTAKPAAKAKTKAPASTKSEIFVKLNLSDNQIKSVETIERKFARAKRKLKKEKQWAGAANRAGRAKHVKSKKKAITRVLGADLSDQYFALVEAQSETK